MIRANGFRPVEQHTGDLGEESMVDQVNELAGKVAIVTGSSRNIGRATAEELARAGAAVVGVARIVP